MPVNHPGNGFHVPASPAHCSLDARVLPGAIMTLSVTLCLASVSCKALLVFLDESSTWGARNERPINCITLVEAPMENRSGSGGRPAMAVVQHSAEAADQEGGPELQSQPNPLGHVGPGPQPALTIVLPNGALLGRIQWGRASSPL